MPKSIPNWDDTKPIESKDSKVPTWDETDELDEDKFVRPGPQVSKLESFMRGGAQGGSLGFADEITAAGESSLGSMGLVPDKTYDQALEESRQSYKHAQDTNPGSFLAGEIGGGVATTFIPGLGLAKGAKMASVAGRAAFEGGINALGRTENDKLSLGSAEDVVQGTMTGGMFGVAGYGIGKALKGITTAGKTASNLMEGVDKRFDDVIHPKQDPGWADIERVAKKSGLDPMDLPEEYEFGKNSITNRLNKVAQEGIFGEDGLKKYERHVENINRVLDDKIKGIGGGKALSQADAGRVLKEGYDKEIDRVFSQIDVTYKDAGKLLPKMELDETAKRGLEGKLRSIEEWATGQVEKGADGVQRAQAQNILENISTIRKYSVGPSDILNSLDEVTPQLLLNKNQEARFFVLKGRLEGLAGVEGKQAEFKRTMEGLKNIIVAGTPENINQRGRAVIDNVTNLLESSKNSKGAYKDLVEIMQNIGRTAFKNKHIVGQIPPDTQKMRELYFSLSGAALETLEKNFGAGKGTIPNNLLENNKIITQLAKDRSLFEGVLNNEKMAGEDIFKSLIMNGDTKQLEALKRRLPPETFNQLKGTYLENITSRNAEGNALFGGTLKNLNKRQSAGTLEQILDPSESGDIKEFLEFGQKTDFPFESRSRTGGSNRMSQVMNALGTKQLAGKFKEAARAGKPLDERLTAVPTILEKTAKAFGAGHKYSRMLEEASKRGGQAMSATSYILQQRDPEFRKKMRDDEENE